MKQKRFKVIDRENETEHEYSGIQWYLAWTIVWACGLFIGYMLK